MIYLYYVAIPFVAIYFSNLLISFVPGITGGDDTTQKHNLKNVDGLRGIAAFIVVFHHSF